MVLTSNDPQTIIRTARRPHGCDCHLRIHHHGGQPYGTPGVPNPSHWCENIIEVGDVYPEYLGEVANFQSGSRYCPDCRKDHLGDWISA